MRALLILFLAAWTLAAANFKLFLKDGTWQVVTEYKVEGDRIRYYSVERGDWEEVPADFVDLRKTESVRKERAERAAAERAATAAEDKAEREAAREIQRVPLETGVYQVDGENVRTFTAAETKVTTSKGRKLLQVMSPLPVFTGKATVDLDGEHSKTVLTADRPEFFVRIPEEKLFAIVRLKPKKNGRIVEDIQIIPVVKEMVEVRDEVEAFRHQLESNLFKLWPQKPMPPGEYAVLFYVDGKVEVQVFDFAISPPR